MKRYKGFTLIEALIVFAIIVVLGMIVYGAVIGVNSLQDRARETVIKSGFTNVQMGGRDYWACGKDDSAGWKFTATNPQGIQVTGTSCCAFFKGCTLRY